MITKSLHIPEDNTDSIFWNVDTEWMHHGDDVEDATKGELGY